MNRAVIITGASGGLGVALTRKFLDAGDRVFAIGRRRSSLRSVFKQLPPTKNWRQFSLDLTCETSVRSLIRRIYKAVRRIDILINTVGYGGKLWRTEEHSLKNFRKHFAVNLQTAFLMCKYTIPIFLRQRQGLIINVASMAAKRAVPGLFAYSAAKAGLLALSQCVAKENSGSGLKCLTVCPGGMNTKMRADLFGSEDAKKQQSPEYVADVILKVASDEIQVESGGDIVIRHGKITAINPAPPA
ncbi:MAG: SDR family oxidoreductase [Candidatus Omnitrophica bacterium]|nr:SDR family oxidoreductase [Candidatus Omnitrophota bacterium]